MKEPLDRLEVEMVNPRDLIPYSKNARKHSDEQIAVLVQSIKEFGFTNPVLIHSTGRIIAGHGRVQAALKMGKESIPAIRLNHLNDVQVKALTIADNQLATLAGWDFDILASEIDALNDEGFDMSLLGFSDAELDELIGSPDVFDEPEEEENKQEKDTCICPKCHFEFIK